MKWNEFWSTTQVTCKYTKLGGIHNMVRRLRVAASYH